MKKNTEEESEKDYIDVSLQLKGIILPATIEDGFDPKIHDSYVILRQCVQIWRAMMKRVICQLDLSETLATTLNVVNGKIKCTTDKELQRSLLNVFGKRDEKDLPKSDIHIIAPDFKEVSSSVFKEYLNGFEFTTRIWDVLNKQASALYTAKHPEFKIKRNNLTKVAQLPIPNTSNTPLSVMRAPASGVLDQSYLEFQGDSIVLCIKILKGTLFKIVVNGKVESNGKTFTIGDESTRRTLQKMISGEITYSNSYINFDKNGKIRVRLSYQKKIQKKELSSNKILIVNFEHKDQPVLVKNIFTPEGSLKMQEPRNYYVHQYLGDINSGLEKHGKWSISVDNTIRDLNAVQAQMNNVQFQKASNKNIKNDCGHLDSRLENLTKKNQKIRENYNHYWSNSIVESALRYNCGTIEIDEAESSKLSNSGFSWNHSQLYSMIEYKAKVHGIKVKILEKMTAK